MFASKTNAQSFIDKLSEKNFAAYVAEFVSSDGAVKYNVRVGHFPSREEARERLKDYQQLFSSPAYVVIAQ
jgi:cell division septation protein DedD